MKKVVLVALVFCLTAQSAFAWPWNRRSNRNVYYGSTTTSASAYHGENSTAQGIANIMARLRRVGHFGGNPGYEGCGSGPTKEAAYNNCCYARSGMTTVDVGYAQDSSGTWYCCRRYQ